MGYKSKTIAVSVYSSEDNPIFGETATHICIEDEAGGPFLVLKQYGEYMKAGECRFDPTELNTVTNAAKKLFYEYINDKT